MSYHKTVGEAHQDHWWFPTCECDGCWACTGHVEGCTCDVDWDALYERARNV